MALRTTAGQALVNDVLPEDLRSYERVLDKKGTADLMRRVAREHPERYKEVLFRLGALGRRAAFHSGSLSFGLKHMRSAVSARDLKGRLEEEVAAIEADESISEKEKREKVLEKIFSYQAPLERAVYDESLAEGNPLAYQVLSGARGNKTNLRSLRGADLLYVDDKDRPIPVPILRSYSEGLEPHHYYAGAFGARKGVIDVKQGVADSGFACLAAGTLVLMAEGPPKEIRDVSSGDVVTGADLRGRTFPVKVVARHDNGARLCRLFTWGQEGRASVLATEDHKALGLRRAQGELEVLPLRDAVEVFSVGDGLNRFRVSGMPVWTSTYDLEVDHPDHLFVLASGLIVSNSKQLVQMSHRLVTTAHDDDAPPDGIRGLPVDIDDPDNEGALLAHDIGDYKRNTVLTPHVIQDLKHRGHKELLVRSPTVGGPPDGGVYSRDVGVREKGVIAPVGDFVGVTAAQALCLEENTPVRMADGSEKKIKDVRPGETVMGSDRRGDTFPVKVLNVFDNGERDCRHYSWRGGPRAGVIATSAHKVLGAASMKGPPEVRPLGETACAFLAGFGLVYLAVSEAATRERTYDLEVDHPDHLFVLASGLIVSNSEPLTQGTLCLEENTPVMMADGSEKKIKDVRPGETVLGADSRGALFPVKVLNVFNNGPRRCCKFCWWFGGAESNVIATPEHRALRPDGSREGLAYASSFVVAGRDEPACTALDATWGDAEATELLPTYDLEVDHPDHLFVLASGLIVSNSSKHSGGVAGAKKTGPTGFKLLNSLVQVPAVFPGGAAHARADGRVRSIEQAPQGGLYIAVGDHRHYAAPGLAPLVRPGDEVEAGDVLSEGVPNPAEIVRHKGVGEGRAYFVRAFHDGFRRSGLNAHRRNIELVARGLINHVRLTEEHGRYSPDDVVEYHRLERDWSPREGSVSVPPGQAVGRYLEAPVLHYTVGSQIRPSAVRRLRSFGVKNVTVHHRPPPFEPEMVRGMESLTHDTDWMARFLGSYVKKNFLKGVARGDVSDEAGTSYVPSLARGVDFNTAGPVKGWSSGGLSKKT
jgi:hypothetical protein